MPHIVGRQVGPYLLTARLGGGAMASVYRAVDQRSGAPVALKVLLPDADGTVRERFRLEAEMVSGLDHPHVVRTLEVNHGLDALPGDQREVVVLHVWGRLTFQEIATTLAIPLNTAASRYRYGLTKLRETLKPLGAP